MITTTATTAKATSLDVHEITELVEELKDHHAARTDIRAKIDATTKPSRSDSVGYFRWNEMHQDLDFHGRQIDRITNRLNEMAMG